ncbi:MAG: phosphoenolpyruvate carboxylase [Luteibaculaceae bacterium]
MLPTDRQEVFRQLILNKYRVYNSLFLNLPNANITYTGIFIPLLHKLSKEGLAQSKSPKEIIESFIEHNTEFKTQKEIFDFLFKMVQYIERQVVLFDSVEDAAFVDFQRPQLKSLLSPDNSLREAIGKHLEKFSTRLVFTAHPTQFYSNEVQITMYELRKSIKQGDIKEVDRCLQQLAYTPFFSKQKPTPFQEARSIVYYLRYVYYETLGSLYSDIITMLQKEPDFNPSIIELGFWPGGDRDGNPFVTAETTKKVAELLRLTVMKCYYNHIKDLRKKLTLGSLVEPLKALKDRLYQQIFTHEAVITDTEILETLYHLRELIIRDYRGTYLRELNDIIGRVHLFGRHFATLDIRQDSSKHIEAIEEIFKQEFKVDYHSLSDAEKLHYLTEQSLTINPDHYTNEITADTLRNVYQIKEIQALNGERGMHRYIISNSETPFDVLFVYAFFKYCGYKDEDIKIDIIPLFETMHGMGESGKVMKALYENPVYKAHLARRNNTQTVMLGFSDGTKDGGYLKANLEINHTKETLTALTRQFGYNVVFFDGRGGPPARGGGKTYQFYAAQGDEIANDKIQLTIQGQTITSIYGTHEQTRYNVEQLILAGAKELHKPVTLSKENKELIKELSALSYKKYVDLKEHPKFTSYLEQMTTLKYYGETNIGSRPTKRNATSKLTLKDLRAIPFVGSWSMVRQNVPGFYGLGTALQEFAHQPEKIESLYRESGFFRTLIQNSMMSMKKTYFPLTSYMKNHQEFGDFWQLLREEYELTKKWVLHLTGCTELMGNEVTSRMSISARENIVLPLLVIQQYALQKIQEDHPDKETYEKLVVRALFGNINASRNSA